MSSQHVGGRGFGRQAPAVGFQEPGRAVLDSDSGTAGTDLPIPALAMQPWPPAAGLQSLAPGSTYMAAGADEPSGPSVL